MAKISQTMSCNLPLLDGDSNTKAELLHCEAHVLNVEAFKEACKRDLRIIENALCTAWAVLLRLYVGQDDVHFVVQTDDHGPPTHGSKSESNHQFVFHMAFEEQEGFATCLERANECRNPPQSAQSLTDQPTAPLDYAHVSHLGNTALWIQTISTENSEILPKSKMMGFGDKEVGDVLPQNV